MLPAQLMFVRTAGTFFSLAAPTLWSAYSLHPAQAIVSCLQVHLGALDLCYTL